MPSPCKRASFPWTLCVLRAGLGLSSSMCFSTALEAAAALMAQALTLGAAAGAPAAPGQATLDAEAPPASGVNLPEGSKEAASLDALLQVRCPAAPALECLARRGCTHGMCAKGRPVSYVLPIFIYEVSYVLPIFIYEVSYVLPIFIYEASYVLPIFIDEVSYVLPIFVDEVSYV